jgi:hypothetical protein
MPERLVSTQRYARHLNSVPQHRNDPEYNALAWTKRNLEKSGLGESRLHCINNLRTTIFYIRMRILDYVPSPVHCVHYRSSKPQIKHVVYSIKIYLLNFQGKGKVTRRTGHEGRRRQLGVQVAWSLPGPVWTDKKILPPLGLEPRTIQLIASRYTYYVNPAPLKCQTIYILKQS